MASLRKIVSDPKYVRGFVYNVMNTINKILFTLIVLKKISSNITSLYSKTVNYCLKLQAMLFRQGDTSNTLKSEQANNKIQSQNAFDIIWLHII